MLYLFSVNGKLLHEADAMEHLHAWALTPDGRCLLTGSERMIVKLRCLDDLRAMHVFPRVDAPIHSLSLTPEERVVLVRTINAPLKCARANRHTWYLLCRWGWVMGD